MIRIFDFDATKGVNVGLLIILAFIFLLPQAEVLANPIDQNALINEESEEIVDDVNLTIRLPDNEIKALRTVTVSVTAYNAVPEQTDASPCLTADGTNVCDNSDINIVAANWLPFGTKIRIPEVFGDTIFEVHDRMNQKHSNRLDILMDSVTEAKRFGRQQLKIEILSAT